MSDEYGEDFNRILAGDDVLGDGEQPRPVSRRERIAVMRDQARADERRRIFRIGLAACAAIVVIAVAVVVVVAGG